MRFPLLSQVPDAWQKDGTQPGRISVLMFSQDPNNNTRNLIGDPVIRINDKLPERTENVEVGLTAIN
jgi:hypothetical protein